MLPRIFKTKEEPLIMVRYQKDIWLELYQEGTEDVWEDIYSPRDLTSFIKSNVVRSVATKHRNINNALIATIDSDYLDWLKRHKRKHSDKNVIKYVKSHIRDIDLWSSKLIDSEMTTAYNVLGIPILMMPCDCDNGKSEYSLNKNTATELCNILKTVYQNQNVYAPGWVLKGCDMPLCVDDIIRLSEAYWQDGMWARIGKYNEQNYTNYELIDKFAPLHFVIPFVVKVTINDALVNLSGNYSEHEQSSHAMTFIKYNAIDKIRLLSIIKNDIPHTVSIGPNSVMPGQACVIYKNSIMKRLNEQKNKHLY